MTASHWLPLCLVLCLTQLTLQKGVPPRANGALGRMYLPSMMRGAGMQPGAGAAPLGEKGYGGAAGFQPVYGNGYGGAAGIPSDYAIVPGRGLPMAAIGNGGKGPKPAGYGGAAGIQPVYGNGYGAGAGYPRGAPSVVVPGRIIGTRKAGYRDSGYGYPTGYQNGYMNGQRGVDVALGRGKQGIAPGYANGGGVFPAAGMAQPAYGKGYRNGNGFANGYGIGYGRRFAPGPGNGYGGAAGIQPVYGNGYGGAAGIQPVYGNGAGAQAGAGSKGPKPAGYGGAAGIQPVYANGYGGAAGIQPVYGNGAGAQAGAGIKGPKPAVYGAGAFPGGYQGAGGFLGAGGYQGAGAYPGAQLATSYGNGYPSVLADGAGYGGKAGKGLDAGQALYGGQQGLANGLTVDAAAAKYGAGLPYNGQPVMPAGLAGAGQLPYGMPQAGLGMLGDLAAAKYGAKDAQYQANQYYGNGNGGCPSGKCTAKGKK